MTVLGREVVTDVRVEFGRDHIVDHDHEQLEFDGPMPLSSRAEIEARYTEDQAVDMSVAYAAAREQGDEFAQTTITELVAAVRNFEAPKR